MGPRCKTVVYTGEAVAEGDLDAFTRDMAGCTELGIDTVILGPRAGEPAAFIENFAAPAVRRPAGLD